LLVNRSQVEGGANMTKHQFVGHSNPPFTGKYRTSSFTSPSTRRTAAGGPFITIGMMGPYFIANRNIPLF